MRATMPSCGSPATPADSSSRSARCTRPTAQAALGEIDRVAAAGAAWLKLHPNTQRFDVADPAVDGRGAPGGRAGLPVLFDAYSPWDANQPGKFVNLATAVPEARLILAHAHGPGFPQLLVLRHPRPVTRSGGGTSGSTSR